MLSVFVIGSGGKCVDVVGKFNRFSLTVRSFWLSRGRVVVNSFELNQIFGFEWNVLMNVKNTKFMNKICYDITEYVI